MGEKHPTKPGDTLYNVEDILGGIHSEAIVINTYVNTISIRDLADNSTWIVSKLDIHEKIQPPRFGEGYDVRGTKKFWRRPEKKTQKESMINASRNGKSCVQNVRLK